MPSKGAFAFARGDIDELGALLMAVHEAAAQLYDMAVGADLALKARGGLGRPSALGDLLVRNLRNTAIAAATA